MDYITKVPKTQQHIFNSCRLNLKLEYVHELFTSDNKPIRKSVWNGLPPLPMILSTVINHPPTPQPSKRAWAIWRSCLIHIWNVSETGMTTRATRPISKPNHATWIWFYHSLNGRLYRRIDKNIATRYVPATNASRCSYRLNKIFQCTSTAGDTMHIDTDVCIPVSVFQNANLYFQIEGSVPQHTTNGQGSTELRPTTHIWE